MNQRAELPEIVAEGTGGRIELFGNRLRIVKSGFLANLLDIAGVEGALVETVIPLDLIAGFKIIEPLVLPQFIVFSYPGSPPFSGSYLTDAFGENAQMMNLVDNRRFAQLAERLERRLGQRADRMLGISRAGRPSRRGSGGNRSN